MLKDGSRTATSGAMYDLPVGGSSPSAVIILRGCTQVPRAVHGMHAMYSVGIPRSVGCLRHLETFLMTT
jgi:hypothetical protein